MNICNYIFVYIYIYITYTTLCICGCQSGVSAEETSVFTMFFLQDIAVWPLLGNWSFFRTKNSPRNLAYILFPSCSNSHGFAAAPHVCNHDLSRSGDVARGEARKAWVLQRMVSQHLLQDWSQPHYLLPGRFLGRDDMCASHDRWFRPCGHQWIEHGSSSICCTDLRPQQNEPLREVALQEVSLDSWRDVIALGTHGTEFDFSNSSFCAGSGRSDRQLAMCSCRVEKMWVIAYITWIFVRNSGVPALLHESGVAATWHQIEANAWFFRWTTWKKSVF